MNVRARTPSKVRELKQKATINRQTTSKVVPQHVLLPFRVEDHLVKEKKFVGKSKGSGREGGKKGTYRYSVTRLVGRRSTGIEFYDGTITFSKPQMIGKLFTLHGNKYRITGKANEVRNHRYSGYGYPRRNY